MLNVSMRYYPAFLDLTSKRCLLVGAGRVGRRKLAMLLDARPAEILVIDPSPPTPELAELLARPGVVFVRRTFKLADLEGRFLVLAASANRLTNRRIAALCTDRGILCNVVNAPNVCSFIVPALISLGELTVAISTAGLSPALTRVIAQNLREQLACYERLLTVLARLRPLVLSMGRETDRNAEIFRAVLASPLANHLTAGDRKGAADCLQRLLPKALYDHIDAVLDE